MKSNTEDKNEKDRVATISEILEVFSLGFYLLYIIFFNQTK